MQRKIYYLVIMISISVLFSCGEKDPVDTKEMGKMNQDQMSNAVHNVKVEEKIDASSYSYLKVNENGSSYWIAVNKMEINPGDYVIFSKYMEMKDFKSESLDRTFASILFVDDAKESGSNEDLKTPHQNITGDKDESINITASKDGYTVEQIHKQKSSLEFKMVKVRGKVVKVNNGILGWNWVHIQDGTGKEGTHDLLVTTNQTVEIGTTITAEGKVIKDKDFGSGYFYDVLLENSKIIVE